MRTIKILHLYSKSMDLYGDYKNLAVLTARIKEAGATAEITCKELFETIDPKGYDFVYIGHGKAKNLAAVAEHFVQYAHNVKNAIEGGQVWLSVGNSRCLFGKRFETMEGEWISGIGLFDYEGHETGKVYVSDMIGHPTFAPEKTVYGFANRTAYLKGENEFPLFQVITGFDDGEGDGKEGTLYHNFFGTWSLGPLLARNPIMIQEILKRILGDEYTEGDYSLEQKALDLVLKEFEPNK